MLLPRPPSGTSAAGSFYSAFGTISSLTRAQVNPIKALEAGVISQSRDANGLALRGDAVPASGRERWLIQCWGNGTSGIPHPGAGLPGAQKLWVWPN